MRQIHSWAWLLTVLGFVAGTQIAQGQLAWTEKKLELQSDSAAPTVEGRFHFVNSGPHPVVISRVVTSCGCTSAALAKREISPGETGEVVITYRRGSRMGRQLNTIAVEAAGQPATMLTLIVSIPEIVHIEPPFVTWTHDELKTPKTLALKMVVPGKITALEVQPSDPAIAVAVHPVIAGRDYSLEITPRDVSHFVGAILTINCELDGHDRRTFTSYATVQPAVHP